MQVFLVACRRCDVAWGWSSLSVGDTHLISWRTPQDAHRKKIAPPTKATMRPIASITHAATKVLLLAASLLLGPLPSTLMPEYLLSFLAAMACSHQLSFRYPSLTSLGVAQCC